MLDRELAEEYRTLLEMLLYLSVQPQICPNSLPSLMSWCAFRFGENEVKSIYYNKKFCQSRCNGGLCSIKEEAKSSDQHYLLADVKGREWKTEAVPSRGFSWGIIMAWDQEMVQVSPFCPDDQAIQATITLLDPSDGDILSQYAKLVWELHHDEDCASSYFERAVQVAQQNSHVLASYAELRSFNGTQMMVLINLNNFFELPLHHGALTSATT
ncbi:uncharacterized protein [Typha latifolia]|uniref:uncharacterized protein isoform X2 n=1 Tax=Typha latifolia TaxID=4733 RepID=UPI003C2C07C8